MKYINLGRTGTKVSRICLGTMVFGEPNEWYLGINDARPIIKRALDLGINFFDSANVYTSGRSEEIIGEVLKDYRDDVIIGSKVFYPTGEGPNERGLSRVHILQQIEGSLKRLQTDYVDLYQIHRWDQNTPIEETLSTFNNLIQQGKVRYLGGSSMYTWQFAKALWISDKLGFERFETMQNHYNIVYREEEREMIPLCEDQNIGLIPWAPLAGGFVTGRYKRGKIPETPRSRNSAMGRRYFQPEDFDVVECIEEVAIEKDVKPVQIALAWLFHKKYITSPIVGVTRVEYIEDAVDALEIKLSQDDMNRLEAPYKPHKIIGHPD